MGYSYRIRPDSALWRWELLDDAAVIGQGIAETSAQARAQVFEAVLLLLDALAPPLVPPPPLVQ